MATFNDFVQTELPKRPFAEVDGTPGDIPVRSGNQLAARELVFKSPSELGLAVTTFPAAGAISGQRVMAPTGDGRVRYATSDDAGDAHSVLGISANAVADGGAVLVRSGGQMVEPTWSWAPGQPIFCGADGVLTQVAPTTGFSLVVATAFDATTIAISIKQPIVLN